MNVQFFDPFSRAWLKMKTILFNPFDIGKWFALGFTAFLANLTDAPGGGGRGGNYTHGDYSLHRFFDLPRVITEWLAENPFWVSVIIAGVILAIALWVIFVWLSSRGMFMFLDNVVHNRTFIQKPWRDFKNHGDSLFQWRLAFGIFSFVILVGFFIAAYIIARDIYFNGYNLSSKIMYFGVLALIGFALFLIVFFISKLLTDFVVPMMYKYGVSANDAWRKLLPLFSMHAGLFVLYGLFIIGLYILIGIGVALGGFLTCCCGFILIAIPYIGSVILLPVSVTFRAFSLEFLEQFGEEYKISPMTADDSPSPVNENFDPVI
jgi:hypothetical protein